MNIVREGIPYIVVPAILALISIAFGSWYGFSFFVVIALFMAFFFRDPRRTPPSDPKLVVAPADGRVTRVQPLSDDKIDSETLVSIFLSPLDVHINRSPIAGQVTKIAYTPGKFLMATNERASDLNEQNALTLHGDQVTVVCKQIAGILARRIVCWKQQGDNLALGERFGMIKFSSRTDVLLPANVRITVAKGARVKGGVTVIGRIE